MMGTIGFIVVIFILLLFVQQMAEKIYPIVFVLVFFILLVSFWSLVWRPFIEKLLSFFEAVPYSKPLLVTITILVVGDLIAKLIEQFDMESLAYIVLLVSRISALAVWYKPIEQLLSKVQQLFDLFGT